MNRRRFLAGAGGVATVTTAGCLDGLSAVGRSPDETPAVEPGTVPWEGTPPEWTRDTGCDGMHDSVIAVEWRTDSLRDVFVPIRFSDLPEDEQAILWTVLRDGGYGTCDRSAAFDRFVERVGDHYAEQNDGVDGPDVVHLAYRGWYYGLYVEKTDQVFSG